MGAGNGSWATEEYPEVGCRQYGDSRPRATRAASPTRRAPVLCGAPGKPGWEAASHDVRN
jgi:hypothetical protein